MPKVYAHIEILMQKSLYNSKLRSQGTVKVIVIRTVEQITGQTL